ncbi:MAG: DUF2254 domain-containing protein [Hyphomicrobiaceae bacterium]
MTARLRKMLEDLRDAFWLIPAALVALGFILAIGMLAFDKEGTYPGSLLDESWLYSGGPTGARALLGAIASSTITVAGTVFSITIAALTLAAGQMGPRLLRNFTRDRGNQLVLGVFLGTFVYSLLVLRGVRSESEGEFIPHLSVSVSIALALICVGALVWFVDHMAGRINVDTVVSLVSRELQDTLRRLAQEEEGPAAPPERFWRDATPVRDERSGYLLQLDESALADWAAANGTAIRLLKRPGDAVFPGVPIALALPRVEGVERAIRHATAIGSHRTTSADVELAVRQLVEVALRALSPGVNDPFTAISVLDTLGATLSELVPLYLPGGTIEREGRPVLVIDTVDYDGLVDAMLLAIRQSAASNPPVLIRMLEIITEVAAAERSPERWRTLARHADLVLEDAERTIAAPADLEDVRRRHRKVREAMQQTDRRPAAEISKP